MANKEAGNENYQGKSKLSGCIVFLLRNPERWLGHGKWPNIFQIKITFISCGARPNQWPISICANGPAIKLGNVADVSEADEQEFSGIPYK